MIDGDAVLGKAGGTIKHCAAGSEIDFAKRWMTGGAIAATTAHGIEREYHLVSGFQPVDAFADFGNGASTFVPEDHRALGSSLGDRRRSGSRNGRRRRR